MIIDNYSTNGCGGIVYIISSNKMRYVHIILDCESNIRIDGIGFKWSITTLIYSYNDSV